MEKKEKNTQRKYELRSERNLAQVLLFSPIFINIRGDVMQTEVSIRLWTVFIAVAETLRTLDKPSRP